MDTSSFLPILSGMLGGATTAGFFSGPIKTFEDWWFVTYGHKMNERAELIRAKQSANAELLKNEILENASKIDPNNIKEPELKILGPALEASRYYIEDEPPRIMFAKLIASSMDKSKDDVRHPSYVEIIKQMTTLDAENLLAIHLNGNVAPTCKIYAFQKHGESTITKFSNLFLQNPNVKDQRMLGASISNLERLGLISITYQEHLVPSDIYQAFSNTKEYSEVQKFIELENKRNQDIRALHPHDPLKQTRPEHDELDGPAHKPGIILMTQYGENFCATCL